MERFTKLFDKYKEDIIKEFELKLDIGSYQPLLDKLRTAIVVGDTTELQRLVEQDLKDFDFSFLKHLYDSKIITSSYSNDIHSLVDDLDYERLEVEVLNREHAHQQIIKLEKDFTFQHVKEIINRLYEEHKVKPFLISKGNSIKGRIVYQMYDSQKRVNLVQEYVKDTKKGKEGCLRFVGDPQSRIAPVEETSQMYYFYLFNDGKEEFIMLHDMKVKPQECIIQGMVVPLSDDIKLGETLSLGATKKLLIVNTITETIKPMTAEEVKDYTKDWTEESFFKKLFGEFRHPTMYEWLHASWLLSSLYSGYPLHLLVFGPNASGKTMGIIRPTTHVIPDPKPNLFVDGAGSTMKGLVPSFSGSRTSPGLFIMSNRICYVDEFLKLIKRSPKNAGGEQMGLESMTSVLEHQATTNVSGNTEPVSPIATAKALFTTNPERGLEDLVRCNQELGTPGMARFLIYVQTKEHVDFVTENMAKVSSMRIEDAMPKTDSIFINVYDFCNEQEALPDFKRIKTIRDKIVEVVPEGLSEMYRGRYLHHLALLVDGVSKVRWLCNQKDTMEYMDEDYTKAEALMYFIVQSWKEKINFNEIPKYLWKEYLSVEERDLYEVIKKLDGHIQVKDVDCSDTLKKLLSISIVIEKNGVLYTYDNPDVWTTTNILDI